MRLYFEQKQKIITPDFLIKFPLEHPLSQPKLTNVTINATVHSSGRGPSGGSRTLETVGPTLVTLRGITGQLPSLVKAKTSVANFNIRKGLEMGAITTLRKESLARFFNNYLWVVLPKFIENPQTNARNSTRSGAGATAERRRAVNSTRPAPTSGPLSGDTVRGRVAIARVASRTHIQAPLRFAAGSIGAAQGGLVNLSVFPEARSATLKGPRGNAGATTPRRGPLPSASRGPTVKGGPALAGGAPKGAFTDRLERSLSGAHIQFSVAIPALRGGPEGAERASCETHRQGAAFLLSCYSLPFSKGPLGGAPCAP
jgi:ribosomal protein L5